jgi:hypothetical protein
MTDDVQLGREIQRALTLHYNIDTAAVRAAREKFRDALLRAERFRPARRDARIRAALEQFYDVVAREENIERREPGT